MKKYIRTIDGIYEDAGYAVAGWRYANYKDHIIALSQDDYDDHKIIKEAYHIEELGDEFVFIRKADREEKIICWFDVEDLCFYERGTNEKMWCVEDESDIREMINVYDVYAGVWTDDGLKYVAKFTDKREFELL